MSLNNCSNTCNIITTHHARRIIDAGLHPETSHHVAHTDIDGTPFYIKDAPCLKIVLDLKEGGTFVLQEIGIIIHHLKHLRASDVFSSDALQQLRCLAFCPAPFSLQLTDTVELIVCSGCDVCQQPENAAKYLMLITSFLALLTILFSLFLYKTWRRSCGMCSIGQPQQRINTSVISSSPSIKIITKNSDQYNTNQFSDVLQWWDGICKQIQSSDIKI